MCQYRTTQQPAARWAPEEYPLSAISVLADQEHTQAGESRHSLEVNHPADVVAEVHSMPMVRTMLPPIAAGGRTRARHGRAPSSASCSLRAAAIFTERYAPPRETTRS